MGSSHTPQPAKSLDAAEGAVKFQGSHEFFMQCHEGELWRKALSHFCFLFLMRAKTGPCRPFVSVMWRMYHCHLNACLRQRRAGGRWMRWGDEIGIKVILGCRWWKRSVHVGSQGQRFKRTHDMKTWQKIGHIKKKWSDLKVYFQGFPY